MLKWCIVIIWLLLLLLGAEACQPLTQYDWQLATLPEVKYPKNNASTALRVRLGKRLFYDPILSIDSTVSCANCHQQRFAFADSTPVSFGVAGRAGVQNAPSLANVAYAPYVTRAGGVPTLEMQVLVPLQEKHELSFNIVLAAERLQKDSLYRAWSEAAYQRSPDPFVITRALAAFERTLLSNNSAFDRYYYKKEKRALSSLAQKGFALFMSEKTQCSTCHPAPHFTNFAFENNGLYEVYADSGRMRLTNLEADRALFKVPSLRNIAQTAPYMHDGSLANLEAVIEHYDKGGQNNPQKNTKIQALNLSRQEKRALKFFLEALTDSMFLNNPAFARE